MTKPMTDREREAQSADTSLPQEPNEESLQSIYDAEAILRHGGHAFQSVDEMLEAAMKT